METCQKVSQEVHKTSISFQDMCHGIFEAKICIWDASVS